MSLAASSRAGWSATTRTTSSPTYNVLLANESSEHYVLPPELTEDEQLQVAVIVSAEEQK
jgi:hypothetical protein